MNISTLSTEGILSLHHGVKEALAQDDMQPPNQKPFGVREYRDWRTWSDALEAELDSREVDLDRVGW